MEYGLLIIFWYGILHAFGPDHLTAIADFSIGKSKKKTLMITFLFAIGHGLSLYAFAYILKRVEISDTILGYGDIISSCVILSMGLYLLYIVYANKVHLKTHMHNGKEHIHIWFGDEHKHSSTDVASAFGISVLMGIGGVRGMLVTLSAVSNTDIDFTMIIVFALGVMIIFISFGMIILYINKNILNSKRNLKRVITSAGIISLIVGTNMLIG